jgi:hypothetical protein
MAKRELRSAGTTAVQALDSTKNYKLNTSGSLVESTGTPGGTEIVFSGSKSSLRRLADLERNVSILAAKALSDDGSGSGESGDVSYAQKAGKWSSSRTITLAGDLSGNVSIDGSSGVTLTATIAANSVALGTDTTGNYMSGVTAGTGISVSHTAGEGSTATITNSLSTSGGSIGGNLSVTGSITASGEITAYFSDERLKQDIAPIQDALSKVMAIGGYTYKANELAHELGVSRYDNQIGLLAGEVEAVMPELVTQSALAGYKTIRYDKVVSVLVEAIKEQQAMIEELRKDMKKTLH